MNKMILGILLGIVFCFQPKAQEINQAPDFTKQKSLYCVGTAHFDTQWLWTIQTSINEYIPNTMQSNFRLFEKYPDYKFSFEGAFKYMLMKEYYPSDYQKVKDYIKLGKWNVCGSSLDAGDVNIPSPEAIIRLILLGQNFYNKEFGKISYDIYLPDCFGFGYALPTIATHCGLKGFSTQKLSWGSSVGVPFDVGAWQGVDGSKIFAALNPTDYNGNIESDLSNDPKWLETVSNTGKKSGGLNIGYRYYGVGDRGGSPRDSSVLFLEKSISGKGPLKVFSAPADLMANQLTSSQLNMLPQYNGELLMSTHGSGCYTSQCAMKRWNRKNELLADKTERASVIADWMGGAKYPQEKINAAWTRFLWHQFHDDITGTSIPEAYTFSWNDELLSQNQFASTLEDAVGSISEGFDTHVKGIPLIVYNPVATNREDIVEAEIEFKEPVKAIKILNKEGKEVVNQVIGMNGNKVKILFLANLSSLGFEVYDVQAVNKPSSFLNELKITNQGIENAQFVLALDPKTGDVKKITQKADRKELLVAPMHLSLFDDESIEWPAWEIKYKAITAKPRSYVDKIIKIEVVESGPIRSVLKVAREKDGSTFTQYIRMFSGTASDKIEVLNEVNWNTPGTLLKAEFPFGCPASKATYDLGIGTIQRSTNTEKLYEVPAQQWVDFTAADGQYGITIMPDSKYGWDKPNDNTLRLSLIHTPKTGTGFAFQGSNDFGKHEFSYMLYCHKLDWRKGKSQWVAASYNQPLLAFQATQHDGKLGKSFSMANLNTADVMIKAIKKAENSDEIVVRVQELIGSKVSNVKLSFPTNIVSAREVNGAEGFIGNSRVEDGKLVFNLNGYQPKAFALKLASSAVKLKPKTSVSIPLEYNVDGVSYDSNRKDGDIDGKGTTFPAELFPTTLTVEGVDFKFGAKDDGQKNLLTCKGQSIAIPSGSFNKIYILAAAVKNTNGVFSIDKSTIEKNIPYFSGFIGQWDSRKFSGTKVEKDNLSGTFVSLTPAYINPEPVSWVSTHLHSEVTDTNLAYTFGYLYKLVIDVPKGSKTITLPDNPDIFIAAISAVNEENQTVVAAQKLIDK